MREDRWSRVERAVDVDHLEDVALVGEPVKECRGHPLALEDLAPLPERQVADDQQTSPLAAVREDLKQEFLSSAAGSPPRPRSAGRLVPFRTERQLPRVT